MKPKSVHFGLPLSQKEYVKDYYTKRQEKNITNIIHFQRPCVENYHYDKTGMI